MAERENIRSRLKKHQLTQVWLINQLGLRGIVTDKTEMSSVLAGTRSGSKADAIIELSHDILDKYEEGSVLVKGVRTMSVPKSKRGTSKLEVITKANELATHTIHICSNESCFPKRYRWCITAKIVDAAVEISRLINMANSVYVNPESEHWKADWELRRGYQVQALAQTYSLLTMMDIAYRTFGIEGSKMDYWTGLVINVQNLLRNWKRSDENRYK